MQTASNAARLRLATQDEINANDEIKELAKRATEGRFLVVRAVDEKGETRNALPSDANVAVVIPAGSPSAEGARVTTKEQSFSFKTYGALRVSNTECGYQKHCSVFDPIRIQFNNQLTADFRPEQVKIAPEIPGAIIGSGAGYSYITIEGVKRSGVTYTVTLDRAIRDSFGQTLTGANQFTFKATHADARLFSTGGNFVTLDPAARRAFTVYTINNARLKVSLYKVAPEDWNQFVRSQVSRRRNEKNAPPPPGKLVFDKIVDIKSNLDELTETAIDLSPALTNGYGQVFVHIEPVENARDDGKPIAGYDYHRRNERAEVEAWVHATDIALDAFADNAELVAWTNSLKDGSPLAGVELSVTPDDLYGMTAANGVARLAFKDTLPKSDAKESLLVARRGNDMAMLPRRFNPYFYGENDIIPWRRGDTRQTRVNL